MIKTSLPRKNNSFVYGLHNILRVKYEVGHIQLFDKGKVNNLSLQVSTVGSSFIRQSHMQEDKEIYSHAMMRKYVCPSRESEACDAWVSEMSKMSGEEM